MPLHVVQTHGDAAPKESAFRIGKPCLESYCRIHADALVVLEERRPGIKWDFTPEGPKRACVTL
jgi:hypothetical protein